jgi:hypothetical protein
MRTKYGDSWTREDDKMAISHYGKLDYEELDRFTVYHGDNGVNLKTGDACSIMSTSIDNIFEHSTPPMIRGVVAIKIVSKNF